MSILKIAKLGHPILYKKAKLVKNIDSPEIKQIIHNMSETMIDAKGIGLAAPQIHISKQIMIFRDIDQEDDKNIRITALINPTLEKIDDQNDNAWEGCLSIPGMLGRRFLIPSRIAPP